MEQVAEVTQESLTDLVVDAIVQMAAQFARESDRHKWFAYERAKEALSKCDLTPDEYERAIKTLTEALSI